MFNIPKKVLERFSKSISKFQKSIKTARDKDVNESDTVSIINSMLEGIFGYENIVDLTSELSIKGTYCDLAIKINDKVQYLIECKAIGLKLKEDHIGQAVNYGANKGIPWVILTNAIEWHLYKIRFEQPINFDHVMSINFDQINPRNNRDMELLYILTKEALGKNAREIFFNKIENVNKFIIGNLVLNENIMWLIKKELRKFAPDVHIETNDILEILKNDIIKREILEGDEAKLAKQKIDRFYKKIEKQKNKKKDLGQKPETENSSNEPENSAESS